MLLHSSVPKVQKFDLNYHLGAYIEGFMCIGGAPGHAFHNLSVNLIWGRRHTDPGLREIYKDEWLEAAYQVWSGFFHITIHPNIMMQLST